MKPTTQKQLWRQVERIRLANGDINGATRARWAARNSGERKIVVPTPFKQALQQLPRAA